MEATMVTEARIWSTRIFWRSTVSPSFRSEAYLLRNHNLRADEAIRNKSLFQVDGRERVLFDDKLTMELPVHEGESQFEPHRI